MIQVFADAAAGDAEIAEAWAEYERRRLQDGRVMIASFAPWLREGLDVDRATEVFWALFSHAPITNLVRVRGWTVDAYVDFLVDSLDRVLLD